MKTSRLLLVAGLLAGTAAFLSAGPSPQFSNRLAAPKPAPVTAAGAPAANNQAMPVAAVCTTCACGKKA
jgi:hypothetical protein